MPNNKISDLGNNKNGDIMKHEVDLSDYNIRTDLTIEAIEKDATIAPSTKTYDQVRVTEIDVDEEKSKIIGKKIGKYVTIEFDDVTDKNNKDKVLKIFIKELEKFIKLDNKNDLVLVIGLGNDTSTPDSLGPLAIDGINVTNHLYELSLVDENYQRVAAITPSVMGKTGIETSTIIKSIADATKPKLIIVIDSLASTSVERLNRTIQITNSGIFPGSGIGNRRKEISLETLNIPVIAIGIPTVVDAITIVSDTINYMIKHYIYTKEHLHLPKYKLVIGNNYLKEDIKINNQDKELLLGLVGHLSDYELRSLLNDVLSPIGYNLIVTPTEIDYLIDSLASIICQGINEIMQH